jgi:radical SAM protein with 4Fe4S-binding SPASM domain
MRNPLSYKAALRAKNTEAVLASAEKMSDVCTGMPIELFINDTRRCNLECIMCQLHVNATGDKRHLDMDRRLFKKIAKESFPYLCDVTLSVSGEPFMNPFFFQELDLIERYSVKLSLFSNVTLIPSGKKLLRLVKNLSSLFVSVDGATQRTYEHIRQGASFRKVVENIKRFNLCRSAVPFQERPRLIFWLVLMRSNIEELPEYIKFAHSFGADGIGFSHASVIRKEMERESLLFHKELANRYLKRAKETLAHFKINALAFPPLFSLQSPLKKKKEAIPLTACRFPWERAVVEINGDVYPCCAPNREGLLMGNLRSQGMREIWNSSSYQSLRRSFRARRLYPACVHCYQRLKETTSDDRNIYFNNCSG